MDFTISEKMKTILGMIDEFVDKELIPLEPEFLTTPSTSLLPLFEEKRKLVRQMELWAPNHPKEYGGMELNLMEHALVSESLGRSPLGHYIFGCQAPDAGNIEILHQFGSEAQKEKYLRPLVDGKIRSCFSMTQRPLKTVMIMSSTVKSGILHPLMDLNLPLSWLSPILRPGVTCRPV